MKYVGFFLLGALAATAIATRLIPADPGSCCERVAAGARDKIAGATGPFSGLVSGLLDATGLTQELPGLLDFFGVPTGSSS